METVRYTNNELASGSRPIPEGTSKGDTSVPSRGKWSNSIEFTLSIVGFAVGLGNVWRFPKLVFDNGGGAFLIPYWIMVFFVGLPLMYIEIAFGQFSGCSAVYAYGNAIPIFQGIGIAMCYVSFAVSIYYNMIMGWALYYFFTSFKGFVGALPWTTCSHEYNDQYCFSDILKNKSCFTGCDDMPKDAVSCNKTLLNHRVFYNGICYSDLESETYFVKPISNIINNASSVCMDLINAWRSGSKFNITTGCCMPTAECQYASDWPANISSENINTSYVPTVSDIRELVQRTKWESSAAQYFTKGVLNVSDEKFDANGVQLHLLFSYFLAWFIVFLACFRGIKSSGKAVYFTATFPYVVILVLLIRGLTLDGASKGIEFYITPDFSKLGVSEIWAVACGQIFFSLSNAMGGMISLASYNEFNNNILRDCLITAIGNCMTSFIAGFAIFSITGFLAHEMNREVPDVVKSGTALAFVSYPIAINQLPFATILSFLFFFMLVTLAIDSSFAMVEFVLTTLYDTYPQLRRHKPLITGLYCMLCFILGIIFTTDAGSYYIDLVDKYAGGFVVMVIGLLEFIALIYLYGFFRDDKTGKFMLGGHRLLEDIDIMLSGIKMYSKLSWLKYYWLTTWYVTGPILLVFGFAFTMINFKKDDAWETTASFTIGWIIALLPLLIIIPVALYKYFKLPLEERSLSKLLRPTANWHPLKAADRVNTRYEMEGDRMNKTGAPNI